MDGSGACNAANRVCNGHVGEPKAHGNTYNSHKNNYTYADYTQNTGTDSNPSCVDVALANSDDTHSATAATLLSCWLQKQVWKTQIGRVL